MEVQHQIPLIALFKALISFLVKAKEDCFRIPLIVHTYPYNGQRHMQNDNMKVHYDKSHTKSK